MTGPAAIAHKLALLDHGMAANSKSYAIGESRRNGFHIRKVVWGHTMATEAIDAPRP